MYFLLLTFDQFFHPGSSKSLNIFSPKLILLSLCSPYTVTCLVRVTLRLKAFSPERLRGSRAYISLKIEVYKAEIIKKSEEHHIAISGIVLWKHFAVLFCSRFETRQKDMGC